MLALVLFLLFLTPIVEIAVFVEVGGRIGAFPTVGVTLLTAAAGIALLRHQGLKTLETVRAGLESGEAPVEAAIDGLVLLAAGGLLLIPGFVTDALGLILFVPPVRRWLRRRIAEHFAARVEIYGAASRPRGTGAGPVIEDAEYQEVAADTPPRGPETDRRSPP